MGKICNTEKAQSRRRCPVASHAKAVRSRWSPHYKHTEHSEQHKNAPNGPRLFACPFAKHDPSAVPRSCFLGWHSISRVKEHLRRRHNPSSDSDLHRRGSAIFIRCCGSSKCAACKMKSLQLNEAASEIVRSRSPDCVETWTQIYCTIYPHAIDIPSPYIEHHEPSQETARNVIREFSQVLCDGLDDLLRSTSRGDDRALARQLQDYVLSQGRRYIESEQHEEPESLDAEWATSELASSERILSSTSCGSPAPPLGLDVGNDQDSLVMPATTPYPENPWEALSYRYNWEKLRNSSSSLTSELMLAFPDLVSLENTSPNGSGQTAQQFSKRSMLMDLNPYPCLTSLEIPPADSSSSITEAQMEQQSYFNFIPWDPFSETFTATECY